MLLIRLCLNDNLFNFPELTKILPGISVRWFEFKLSSIRPLSGLNVDPSIFCNEFLSRSSRRRLPNPTNESGSNFSSAFSERYKYRSCGNITNSLGLNDLILFLRNASEVRFVILCNLERLKNLAVVLMRPKWSTFLKRCHSTLSSLRFGLSFNRRVVMLWGISRGSCVKFRLLHSAIKSPGTMTIEHDCVVKVYAPLPPKSKHEDIKRNEWIVFDVLPVSMFFTQMINANNSLTFYTVPCLYTLTKYIDYLFTNKTKSNFNSIKNFSLSSKWFTCYHHERFGKLITTYACLNLKLSDILGLNCTHFRWKNFVLHLYTKPITIFK